TYYKGAKRDPGLDEGATTVAYVAEKGWFWYIPLPDDVVSVGIVAEKDYLHRHGKDPQTIFQAEIENNLWINDHLSTGKVIDPNPLPNQPLNSTLVPIDSPDPAGGNCGEKPSLTLPDKPCFY
ncbi:MAG: hypothetical protein HC839_04405, partial [Leptolyngbyaceae cyanobacterium RM2_2_21]|nr:hypothetical protein [Leptolyngbyaceae cyanobacterium RM2_2_21]